MDRVRGLSPIVLVFAILYSIYGQGVPYKKWMIIVGGIIMMLAGHAVYTDTTTFFGSDISKLYGTFTVFLALFGVLSIKTEAVK